VPPPVELAPLPAGTVRLCRHRIDPFAEPAAGRRLWRRRGEEPTPTAQVPVLPRHAPLPVRER